MITLRIYQLNFLNHLKTQCLSESYIFYILSKFEKNHEMVKSLDVIYFVKRYLINPLHLCILVVWFKSFLKHFLKV